MAIRRLLLLAGFVSGLALSAAEPHALTVDDLWALKRVGPPSLSPDGRWAVVEVTTPDMKENDSPSDLWLLATDGSARRQLTANKARDSDPLWSPDGQWIAFTSKREGDEQAQAYVISPSGGEARRLTKLSTGAGALRWFPGSQRLAFLSSVWPELKSDEQQAQRLKERAEAKVKAFAIETTSYRYWDRWLTDGRVSHVHAVEVVTGDTRDLMAGWTNGVRAVEPSADLYDLAPDGQELAFVAELGLDPGTVPTPISCSGRSPTGVGGTSPPTTPRTIRTRATRRTADRSHGCGG